MAGFAGRYTWDENWDPEKEAHELGENVGYAVGQLYCCLRLNLLYSKEDAKKLIHDMIDKGTETSEIVIDGFKAAGYFEEGKPND